MLWRSEKGDLEIGWGAVSEIVVWCGRARSRWRYAGREDAFASWIYAEGKADASFSKLQAGALLATKECRIVTAYNVKKHFHGLTMCAEQVAISDSSFSPLLSHVS